MYLLKLFLKLLLILDNFLYKVISFVVVKYEKWLHPKHRIMKYHDFFTNNIKSGSSVLDIGCGIWALSFNIAKKAKTVVGIDISKTNIQKARKKYKALNIKYIYGDATKYKFYKKFDYITLSNVLEHIKERTIFLKSIQRLADTYLIRVPMIDRERLVVFKKEIWVDYRLDRTHYIEYTLNSFEKEMKQAWLEIKDYYVKWGEIYAIVKKKF